MACRPAVRIDVGDTVGIWKRYDHYYHIHFIKLSPKCTYDLISLDFHEGRKLDQAEFVRGNRPSLPWQLCGRYASFNLPRYRRRWFARCIGWLGERLDAVIIESIGQCKCVIFFNYFKGAACVANLLLRCARLQTGLPKLLKRERERGEIELIICIN